MAGVLVGLGGLIGGGAAAHDDADAAPVGDPEVRGEIEGGLKPPGEPRVLPEKLAPRSVPPVDAAIPPSASRRPSTLPATDGKSSRKPGTPVEIRAPEDGFNAQLGSQAARGGGVLGRYDGVMASQAIGDAAKLNLVSGFPLAQARFDPNRSFYALSLDLEPFDGGKGRVFGVQQRIDAEQQRNAVGGELGFDHARGFGLLSVDYDVDFRDVGVVSLLASTRLGERTTLNAFVDARRYSNAPSAYAAVQDASVASVEQLFDKLSQSELRAPSFDSAAQTRTVALGAARQITPRLRLAGDVTRKDVIPQSLTQGAPAPAGQLDYSVRATWKDLLIAKSSTTARLRIADLPDSRRYSGSLGGQYPLLQNLKVGPDLAFEFADVQERWTYKPSMRFEYLQSRLKLDFQLGLELSDMGVGAGLERTGVFYKVGYRYDF
jgi:hypothetical protein